MKPSYVVSVRVSEREYKALEVMSLTVGNSISGLLRTLVRTATFPTLKAVQDGTLDLDSYRGLIDSMSEEDSQCEQTAN